MIKFKISADRFAEACNTLEYLNITSGNKDTAIRILPRFVMNGDNDYIVKVSLDDDGDITGFENIQEALLKMAAITPRRAEKLAVELMEAAKAIVNPPNAGG